MSGARAADLLERELPAAVRRREAAFGEETVWVDRDDLVAGVHAAARPSGCRVHDAGVRHRGGLARPRARRSRDSTSSTCCGRCSTTTRAV